MKAVAPVQATVHTMDILGESPVWDTRDSCLYWVDTRSRLVHCWRPETGEHQGWEMEELVGSLCLRESGGLLVALSSGLSFLDTTTGSCTTAVQVHHRHSDMRFNDGRCGPDGRFWVASMNDRTRAEEGILYSFDREHQLEQKLRGLQIPNSLCWSPDGCTLYLSDSRKGVIWQFTVDHRGTLGEQRVFATIPSPGVPDGATVDTEGCLWCAVYGDSCILRLSPAGQIVERVDLPVLQPTSCTFGGPDLGTLYITSARQRLSAPELERQPLAGAVLSLQPGYRGIPESRFGG